MKRSMTLDKNGTVRIVKLNPEDLKMALVQYLGLLHEHTNIVIDRDILTEGISAVATEIIPANV